VQARQNSYHHSPNKLNSIIVQNLTQIIGELDLDLKEYASHFQGACPVHGGDSHKAFTIYKTGKWFCWSRHCEEDLGSDVLSLLIHLKGEEVVTWLKTLKHDPNYEIPIKTTEYEHNLTRREVRKTLHIPAEYYIKKGFSPQILDEYDVGYCADPNDFMFGRVVFPIYDQVDKYVGSTGRTIYPVTKNNPKWVHYKVKTSNYLYNLNRAYSHIEKLKTVVLVESCGNLLKLVENDVHVGLATFGAHLSKQQEIKIECSPAKRLILAFDGDDAGRKGAERIFNKYNRKYEILTCIGEGDIVEHPEHIERIKELL
jgi:hypothetical protein